MSVITSSIQSKTSGPRILVVVGATASGKSATAISIAETAKKKNINSVIINADSQQMYRELRILTARPSPEDEAKVPHRLYGTLSAGQRCSAGVWLNLARMEIDWALAEGMLPIVTGGTGLYIRALLEGIADIPAVDEQVRRQVKNDMAVMGHAAFHERLSAIDPALGAKLKVGDTQRLLRGYEVWLGTGKPLSWWQEKAVTPPYQKDYFDIYQVDIDRKTLYERCNQRFLTMMDEGALEEVKLLLSMNLDPDLPAMKSVGVAELGAYLSGDISLDEAIAKAQQATRNYAKRQLTWFRHQLAAKVTDFGTKIIDSPEKINNILTTFNK